MVFFTDTNIPIGYTIIYDKFHDQSKIFINKHENDSIFWSNLVEEEYRQTLNDIIDEVNIFMNYSKSALKKKSKRFHQLF